MARLMNASRAIQDGLQCLFPANSDAFTQFEGFLQHVITFNVTRVVHTAAKQVAFSSAAVVSR